MPYQKENFNHFCMIYVYLLKKSSSQECEIWTFTACRTHEHNKSVHFSSFAYTIHFMMGELVYNDDELHSPPHKSI